MFISLKEKEISSDNNNNNVKAPSLNHLNQRVTDLKSYVDTEVHQLKSQDKLILKRLETTADKFKSFKCLKKELKALFAINGHSAILGTNNPVKKLFGLISFIVLTLTGMLYVHRNLESYQMNEVVTQIKEIDVETLTFPAVTFCLLTVSNNLQVNSIELEGVLTECYFESRTHKCTLADFETIQIYMRFAGKLLSCSKYNGGSNGARILTSSHVGTDTGLNVRFDLLADGYLFYHVGDSNVKPIGAELDNIIQLIDSKYIGVQMKKTFYNKLPKPYSNCTESITAQSSFLASEFFEQNITYRQKHCFEICYARFLNEYAQSRNISLEEAAYELSFSYKKNCSEFCPLECSSNSYELHVVELSIAIDSIYINFYYTDRNYVEVSQSIKTTAADLIANTGGILGLFIEFSFFSVCRLITFIFDIFFA